MSWNLVFQELNRSFPSFKTLTFTTRLSTKPLLWKWNCLRDTTTFLMWWLQTNLSKFDSVLNVMNQVKFRRICMSWSHLSITGLISQRQFAPKCWFLASMPFVLLECPEKSPYFTSLIFMKSHFGLFEENLLFSPPCNRLCTCEMQRFDFPIKRQLPILWIPLEHLRDTLGTECYRPC